MNSKHMMTMACAAALCGSVLADTDKQTDSPSGFRWAMGEGVSYNEQPIVSSEVSFALDSKFMSYGLVDNNEPIFTPAAAVTWFDWLTVSVEAILDVTGYGDKAGYGARRWRHQEIDPGIALAHSFGPDDVAWLPTTVEFELGYMYEGHPQVIDDDTQFINFAFCLPDFWLEPVFAYERDIDRDKGTYLNIELGHTFSLIGPREEDGDDVLSLRLSVAQGWGDSRRIGAYLEDLEKAGMMDTCFKGEMSWNITDGVSLSGYVAYYDYMLDSDTREHSRVYEATEAWDSSWNIVTGVSLAFAF